LSLTLDTQSWPNSLWKNHLDYSTPARNLVADGRTKQRQFPAFGQDVHSLLYARNRPLAKTKPTPPQWATDLLAEAETLPDWHALRQRVQGNGFAAGFATEAILRGLLSLVPQETQQQKKASGMPDPDDQRRALRQAVRGASDIVDKAEGAVDGLLDSFGLHYGTTPGHQETLRDVDELRRLYEVVCTNPRVREIALLAGRLRRLAAAHKRTKVAPATGSIKGITIGGDIERLLPSALVGLRSPTRLVRLLALQTIMERRAFQYDMSGEIPEVQGPLVMCVDRSGSMGREETLLADAVALALLHIATEQRRAWHLIGFDSPDMRQPLSDTNSGITDEHTVKPGEMSVGMLAELFATCYGGGGTNFDQPLLRAMDLIETSAVLRKADVVFLTDGQSYLAPTTAARMHQLRAEQGVQLYCIGVGRNADVSVLAPVASAYYLLRHHPSRDSGELAPMLAAVSM
jgi:uncharacterized protein with von Willebrand factor type A (vWA) domain